MALSLKRKLNSDIKTVTKTNIEKTDIVISEDQKKYLKARKRLLKGQSMNQESGSVNSNFNYYISFPAMTSYYTDNYQTPESNNNMSIVAEWRPHPNFYNPARVPVAFVAPQMRTSLHPYRRALITADPVVPSVGQPVMVPAVAPTLCPNFYGYPWTHKVTYVQETSVQEPNIQEPNIQEPNIQEPNIQEPNIQEPNTQEPNIQEPYIQERSIQQPYLQHPYIQQPFVQQPYVQHPYVHQPYTQRPYAQQPYVLQPYVQQPYVLQPYVQQEPSVQRPCIQESHLTQPYVQESYTTADVMNDLRIGTLEDIESPEQTTENVIDKSDHSDPFQAYLKLPKDLFPTANKLGLDPNPFIDQCCKLRDVDDNAPWILDLELGAPISPTPRTIAIYDIKCNSIRCKQEPNKIHPGFQRCNSDFQKLILRYYKHIVYSWYKGYTIFYKEKSVQNFHAWLLLPMQTYGLCWP